MLLAGSALVNGAVREGADARIPIRGRQASGRPLPGVPVRDSVSVLQAACCDPGHEGGSVESRLDTSWKATAAVDPALQACKSWHCSTTKIEVKRLHWAHIYSYNMYECDDGGCEAKPACMLHPSALTIHSLPYAHAKTGTHGCIPDFTASTVACMLAPCIRTLLSHCWASCQDTVL
jgi:hypothetical protein